MTRRPAHLTCCPDGARFIELRFPAELYDREYADRDAFFAAACTMEPRWTLIVRDQVSQLDCAATIKVCPFCTAPTTAIRLRAKPPTRICSVTDGGTRGVPMLARGEVVGDGDKTEEQPVITLGEIMSDNAYDALYLAMTSKEDRVWLCIHVDSLGPEHQRVRSILLRLIDAGELVDAATQPVRPNAPWDPMPGTTTP